MMALDEIIEGFKVIENQYVLVENRGTFVERILDVFDTEIEALKYYRKVSTKLKAVVKANVIYAKIEEIDIIYSYEEVL
ncbi:hypothetical protein [uncultured Clostridium sp.]|uniref:hypothetical protein n=1 Tax=uncultured Clostridium sp. TaxID=59620 RepID=UPI00260DCF2D|nr:hypothetical protein [uncultured Clostridium sp.]